MADIRVWIHGAVHPAFRCGGWAYVRQIGDQLTGRAGGDRATTAKAMAMTALTEALRDAPAGWGFDIICGDAASAQVMSIIAPDGEMTAEDRELAKRFDEVVRSRGYTFTPQSVRPATPLAFVAAWADLGQDKAKATGKFAAAIPKPNLAKIQGLGGLTG